MLAQIAALAVKDGAVCAMASLTRIELNQRGSPLDFIVDIGQRMQCFIDAAILGEGLC